MRISTRAFATSRTDIPVCLEAALVGLKERRFSIFHFRFFIVIREDRGHIPVHVAMKNEKCEMRNGKSLFLIHRFKANSDRQECLSYT
jgi:hypothetical protein